MQKFPHPGRIETEIARVAGGGRYKLNDLLCLCIQYVSTCKFPLEPVLERHVKDKELRKEILDAFTDNGIETIHSSASGDDEEDVAFVRSLLSAGGVEGISQDDIDFVRSLITPEGEEDPHADDIDYVRSLITSAHADDDDHEFVSELLRTSAGDEVMELDEDDLEYLRSELADRESLLTDDKVFNAMTDDLDNDTDMVRQFLAGEDMDDLEEFANEEIAREDVPEESIGDYDLASQLLYSKCKKCKQGPCQCCEDCSECPCMCTGDDMVDKLNKQLAESGMHEHLIKKEELAVFN